MVRPKDNLPPESQQWRRSLETSVDANTNAIASQNTQLTNALSGVTSSLSRIGQQVQDLSDLVDDLATQQAALAAQQAQITAILANQILATTAVGDSGAAAGIPVGSWGASCASSVTVPSWATRCSIAVTSNGVAASSAGGVGSLSSYIDIAGNAGASQTDTIAATELTAHTNALHQRTFTVTPSSTVNITMYWQRNANILTGRGTFVATVVFTR